MAPKSYSSHSLQKPWIISLVFVYSSLLLLVLSVTPRKLQEENPKPAWFDLIAKDIKSNNIKVGLVNLDKRDDSNLYQQLRALSPRVETVAINFDHVDEKLKWGDFFPEWIDEDNQRSQPKCPEMPMPPRPENYRDLNVVVARVPCDKGKEGIRDVFRLQVNLVVAHVAVEGGWGQKLELPRTVYVVFIGSCGPMIEIFRCNDILVHKAGEYWVYKPELGKLKHKTLMHAGSCQVVDHPGFAEPGKELWRGYMLESAILRSNYNTRPNKEAYVTVLHSSEAYVCGAIALAQSIRQTNSTKDLVLLADDSIGPKSRKGLKSAGWKIKRIQRISNPFAKKGTYNEWNYSKLRIWQLTNYDKLIFIDSDLLVLRNIDDFFVYPQLSAVSNDLVLFNSGLMIIEPSKCMFENLMSKTFSVKPYNGGDQGFLNEVFAWWHRLPWRLNRLKVFEGLRSAKHEIEEDVHAIHYLGLKPWMCYRDYDCNWDMEDHHTFASDSAHRRWWQVYEAMPQELKPYCGLTKKMDGRIRKWRRKARDASLPDGHWKIAVKDPRQKKYVE